MKKVLGFLGFFVLVAVVVVPPLESSFTVSPWGGLTTLAMDGVHRDLRDRAEEGTRTPVGLVDEFITEASTGAPYMVGLDLASLRVAYLLPTTAKVTWNDSSDGYQYTDEITTSFAMALIGIRVPHPTRAIMSIGIYGGYGYAMIDEVIRDDQGSAPIKIAAAGGGIAAEGIFAIQIWRLEINASYRYAVIDKILATKSVDLNDDEDYDDPFEIKKGRALRNADDTKNLVFDYSGIMLTVGLRFGPGPKKSMETLFRKYGPWGYKQKNR